MLHLNYILNIYQSEAHHRLSITSYMGNIRLNSNNMMLHMRYIMLMTSKLNSWKYSWLLHYIFHWKENTLYYTLNKQSQMYTSYNYLYKHDMFPNLKNTQTRKMYKSLQFLTSYNSHNSLYYTMNINSMYWDNTQWHNLNKQCQKLDMRGNL